MTTSLPLSPPALSSLIPSSPPAAINYSVPLSRIDLTLTTISGDADAYITISGTMPSMINAQYRLTGSQSVESVAIRANDSFVAQYCPASGTGPGGPVCRLNIAVRAYRPSNFSLVVTGAASATQLVPNLPLANQFAGAGTYRYYTLKAGSAPTSPVTLSVNPTSGDPDLFVSSSIKGSTTPNMADPTSYCRASLSSRREAIELFPATDGDCWCGNTTGCTYYLGVYAFPPTNATYSVQGQIGAPATSTLLDGQPQYGYTLAGSSAQFSFAAQLNVSAGIKAVEVALNPFLGDADLYVALDGLPASPAHWQYRSQHPEGQAESVVIRPTDAAWISNCGDAAANGWSCDLSVGVFAYTASLWTIVASNAMYLTLPDGVTQQGFVDAGDWAYFRYTLSDRASTLVITLDQLSGDSDVFVGCDSNANTTRPTDKAGSYIWRSSGVGQEVVVIPPTDKRACGPTCSYYLGVTTYRRNATFAVTARTRTTRPEQLSLGQPVTDQVATGEFAYYSFIWDPTALIAWIEVSPTFGDSDLYVRLNASLPSRNLGGYDYTSQSATGLEQVTIRTTDTQWLASPCATSAPNGQCVVTVGVYGFSTSRYTITAWTSLRELEDGVPLVASVSGNDLDYFYYTASDRSTPFSFFVTPLDGGDPDLYVSTVTQFPNATNVSSCRRR